MKSKSYVIDSFNLKTWSYSSKDLLSIKFLIYFLGVNFSGYNAQNSSQNFFSTIKNDYSFYKFF